MKPKITLPGRGPSETYGLIQPTQECLSREKHPVSPGHSLATCEAGSSTGPSCRGMRTRRPRGGGSAVGSGRRSGPPGPGPPHPHTHTHMCITHAAPTEGFPSPRDRPHHHVPLLMAMTARPHGSPCVGDLRRALWNWAVGGWGALGTPGKTESRGQTLPEVTGQWSRGCPQTQV